MNVLVDTSVWSLALRRKPEHLNPIQHNCVGELNQLVVEGRVRLTGLVRQELLSGIKAPAQFEKIRGALRAFPDEPIQTADHEAAAEASNRCRRYRVVVSVVDLLICAVAIRREWSVFSQDPDFQSYARILPIRLHTPRRTT